MTECEVKNFGSLSSAAAAFIFCILRLAFLLALLLIELLLLPIFLPPAKVFYVI